MSEDLKKAVLRNIKIFAVICCLLLIVLFAGGIVAKKLPAPYGDRQIPGEITPWLK